MVRGMIPVASCFDSLCSPCSVAPNLHCQKGCKLHCTGEAVGPISYRCITYKRPTKAVTSAKFRKNSKGERMIGRDPLESRGEARTSLDRRNLSGRLAPALAFAGVGGGFHDPLCGFVPISEQLLQFRVQEPSTKKLTDPAQRGPVIHLVAEEGSPLAIVQKPMAMIPVRKRAANLTIGEHPPWLVLRVFGDPFHGKGADLGSQDSSSARRQRAGRLDDRDLFPGRGQLFQCSRTFVKSENHARRCGNPRLLDKMMHPDVALSSAVRPVQACCLVSILVANRHHVKPAVDAKPWGVQDGTTAERDPLPADGTPAAEWVFFIVGGPRATLEMEKLR